MAFNTSEEYFKELLSSVLNQTYTHFELIVVDVSTAGSTTVKNVLARYNDDRIRVVKAENKSIAENTRTVVTCGLSSNLPLTRICYIPTIM